jgi:hypothetical protein
MPRRSRGWPILSLASLSPSRTKLAGFTCAWDEDEQLEGVQLEIRDPARDRTVDTLGEGLAGPLAIAWASDDALLVCRAAGGLDIELTLHRVPGFSRIAGLTVPVASRGAPVLRVAAAAQRVIVSGLNASPSVHG